MTLGELLEELKKAASEVDPKKTNVYFDFGWTFPSVEHGLDSWRGKYDEVAIEWTCTDIEPDARPPTLEQLINAVSNAIGATMTGYKGGEFTMTKHTPVWVDRWGDGAETALVGVKNLRWKIVLETRFIEL